MTIIPTYLGKFLNFIFEILPVSSFGLAIIIFTIIIKLLLLPLNVKSARSMAALQELNPKLQEIQKRYKNDKEKLQAETMKLYSENKVNPLGGCLPMLIQFPILISLFWVISRPLTYVLQIPSEQRDAVKKALEAGGVSFEGVNYPEAHIIENISSSIQNVSDSISSNILDLQKGMDFLGINLSSIPSLSDAWNVNTFLLVLIPLIATVATFISTKLSMARTAQTSNNPMGNQMNKTMMYMAPAFTLFFAFRFPVGLALYWTASYIFQIFQQLYVNKYVISKKKEVEVK